jgi:NAD(P)-dependent dehydrogenase (short-subunit alcohol dehydrogenase family)
MSPPERPPRSIFFVSDGTGITAETMGASIITRFEGLRTRQVRIPFVDDPLKAREAVRRMSTRHGGTGGAIVNIGSVASKLGSAGQYVDYAAAKGAIDVFTIGLSREVATEGVRVNCVRPGITDTEIHASGGQPERARQLAPLIPMQRPGTADEIAEAVLWLLSDAAAYTTGALLDVTGGR